MGSWGPGLYSNDFAMDVRSTIKAVLRLPFENTRLASIVAESCSDISGNPDDEEYTTFCLVLADQFHRHGIRCQDAFDRAIEIIDSNVDLDRCEQMGFVPSDCRKRMKNLQLLRTQLSSPVLEKERITLKKPQPLLTAPGDILVFPMADEGTGFNEAKCYNPYFMTNVDWKPVDWGATLIVHCGHAFEFLAFYHAIVIVDRLFTTQKPDLERLRNVRGWWLAEAGTCSRVHFQRMKLEIIARVSLDSQKIEKHFPVLVDGPKAAANDISISNGLCTCRPREKPGMERGPKYGVERLDDIADF